VSFARVRDRDRDDVKGVEFSASYQPLSSLSFYANAFYLFKNREGFEVISDFSVELRETEELNTESSSIAPRSVFHWGINYSLLKYATLNLHFSYYAKRKLPQNEFYERTDNVSPYLMVDCNLFIKNLLDDRLEMALKVRNLFKSDYHSRGIYSVIDGAGRGVFFTLKYKF